MIKALKVDWGRGKSTATNAAELGSVVERVRQLGEPTMLFLTSTTGTVLAVGLGTPESVLTFVEEDGTTFHSVGDTSRRGYLKFRNQDLLDDFHAEMAVPEGQAIEAAMEFFDTGERPRAVRWEADW